jgi:hypothetical protein
VEQLVDAVLPGISQVQVLKMFVQGVIKVMPAELCCEPLVVFLMMTQQRYFEDQALQLTQTRMLFKQSGQVHMPRQSEMRLTTSMYRRVPRKTQTLDHCKIALAHTAEEVLGEISIAEQ